MSTSSSPALIIIDMQRGMATAGPRNNPEAQNRVAELLDTWRAEGRTVVHVRHLSRSVGSPFWPGQPGAEFQDRLAPLAHEHVLDKHVTDAFANSGLEHWLHQRSIRELVFCGVSTNMSVEATVRSAGCLGFNCQVVADACYCFDRPDLDGRPRSAEDLHRVALANLQGEYAQVCESAALLAR
ncbi:cysteine hydrolase family protein [Paucibacter sp. Y2R2-4]|uniref:cysteine hydrolase family protein n=1 Tax=Paucibacter sp. Y2R2-4 TaxID=2893553 RepID=UPI0021E3A1FB|nr:cysteine hydrolase family protein [Paucibacter sp. Y2R2-4]MCV2351572.1 cysteine hydrolase [Paucibacter sp. Y2R2-4]